MNERIRPVLVVVPTRNDTPDRSPAGRFDLMRRQLRILQVERAAYRGAATAWNHPLAG